MQRGILVQRAMNARLVIVGDKLSKDPAQVRLPEAPEQSAARGKDWIMHPIGTTQGRPRHDLWTKLR